MSTIGSGHFEALYGGQEGSKVQRSSDIFQQIASNSYLQSTPIPLKRSLNLWWDWYLYADEQHAFYHRSAVSEIINQHLRYWPPLDAGHTMLIDHKTYKKAFYEYLRKGTPILWSVEQERITSRYI